MMKEEPIFTDRIEALAPADFLEYFLTRKNISVPDPPGATAENLENAGKVLKNRFDLIGEAYSLPDRFSWKPNPSRDKEWQIAHHKFYFAVDLIQAYRHHGDPAYLKKWIALIDSWLDEMDSGFITLSDAQVEAKRIEHWVGSFLLLRDTPCRSILTPLFLRRFLERVATETIYISRHLKPVRNHRTFQLFAVFLVGVLFPEFRWHRSFLNTGTEKLTENLLTDFLADGVHVELSTHYHQLVLETALSFVELARLNGISLKEALVSRVRKALVFSMFMQWPNGEIPLINDSDNGDHLDLLRKGSRLFQDDHLLWAASLGHTGMPPERHSRHFDQAGYFVFTDGWGNDPAGYARRQHLFYDCARLGEGSHSHYDLFSFCYYIDGEPAIIDPGRYTYSSDPDPQGVDWRKEFKSTAYHNTVTIDEKDQTRYLSRTKHGPEVEILEKDCLLGERSSWVSAKAKSAEYAPLHRRLLVHMNREYLFVFDRVEADDQERHECAARFHFSPEQNGRLVLEMSEEEVVCRSPLFQIRSVRFPGLEARMERGSVSKQYGVKKEAPVLTLEKKGVAPVVFFYLIAPGRVKGEEMKIVSLRQRPSPSERLLIFEVEGSTKEGFFQDRFFIQQGPSGIDYRGEGIAFQAPFIALRRDRRGRVLQFISQKPRWVTVDGEADFEFDGTENIEWLSEAKD